MPIYAEIFAWPLSGAVLSGDAECVQAALAACDGDDLGESADARTALQLAALTDFAPAVPLLAEAGAELHSTWLPSWSAVNNTGAWNLQASRLAGATQSTGPLLVPTRCRRNA